MESIRKDPIGSAAMQLLLVGADDDFGYLRDLLNTGDGHVDLDHAHSTDEALARLDQTIVRPNGCCTNCVRSMAARQ